MGGPLDKDLAVPLYHQLQAVLKAEIEAGRWRAGDQLPNEMQVAERYGVSKITVRQALQELAEAGYIRREHGRGTFVAERKFDQGPRELTSFTEEMQRHRLTATARILSQTVAPADARVSEALQVPPQSQLFVLKRLRLADGEPVTVQTAHIPAALVPGLRVEDGQSLYQLLQEKYLLHAARARETYAASLADAPTARLLAIPAGSPIFAVERVTLLPNERPFEFVQSRIRGDRYTIVLDLEKRGLEQRMLALKANRTRSRAKTVE
jgi:GntR family transcriptional regulator